MERAVVDCFGAGIVRCSMWGMENEFPTVGGARADYVSASDLQISQLLFFLRP